MAIHLQKFLIWGVSLCCRAYSHTIVFPSIPLSSPQTIETQQKTRVRPDKKLMSQPTTNLRFYQHKINKQYHEVMLNIFIRKPLAPGTLRQSHVSTTPSLLPTASLGNCPASIRKFRSNRPGAGINSFGLDTRKRRRRSRGVGPSVASVAAVVELGDGVAAFDADWHLSPRLTDEYIRWRKWR